VFDFLADRPVLDFLATLTERGTTDEEKLRRPGDLTAWTTAAGITTTGVRVTRDQRALAVRLREAMYRTLSALIDHSAPRREDVELINAAARHPRPVPRLTRSGAVVREGAIEAVLAALACDCIEFFDGLDREHLKRCDDPKCTRLYVDRSRGHRRRWCGMQGCGNRAKAANYRRRRRAATRPTAPPS
jgi:predicted RNA-binding Zn ribbon-like protein